MLILNVDDDIDDREMFRAAIEAIDPKLDCIQFESGSKVLDYLALAELFPNILFVDINMPKMDGYQCVKHLRQIPGNDQMQIVMYSTTFNPEQRERFQDASIKYVKKTSRFSELVHSIRMILLESKELAEKSKR